MTMSHRFASIVMTLAFACALLPSTSARADVTAAARAYTEGQAAQMEGKYERAADSFELAYSIKPSKEALRSAARMRMQAGQLARAANLSEQLMAKYPDDAPSAALAKDIREQAEATLARLAVTCQAPGCSLSVDGRALTLSVAEKHVFYLAPGDTLLEVNFGDAQVIRKVMARAGARIDLNVVAPVRKEKPATASTSARPVRPALAAAPARGGWPRTVLYVGAGVTAALGGVTIWSALDTSAAHDDYVARPTSSGWDDGRAKQLRTNLLLGATAAAAITTTVIAIYFTDWGKRERASLTVAPTSSGATVGLIADF
jgi:hypothetical protein